MKTSKSIQIKIPTIILLLLLLFLFRVKIFKSASNFLTKEITAQHTVAYGFVLSGGAFDRGNEAVNCLKNHCVEKIICTGANQPPDFKALNINMLESELTRQHIIKQIADSTKVELLPQGTSTAEESDAILAFCEKHQLKECLIISNKLHTRRIYNTFYKKFKNKGIKLYIKGANSSVYNEEQWWQNEYGLIAVNNEYIKLIYYLVK